MTDIPKFITFDCYGTLTDFDMAGAAQAEYAEILDPGAMAEFIQDFSSHRRDEVLGTWKPYYEVVANGLARACKTHEIAFDPSKAAAIYDRIPNWGPHPDVVDGLAKLKDHVPLVILSNTMNDLISHNVEKLHAPFAHVFTAEDAKAYKPQMRAFEYMLQQLNCSPKDIMHVSCHYRYDLMTAFDMGFGRRVFVDRGFEFPADGYATDVVSGIDELAALIGL